MHVQNSCVYVTAKRERLHTHCRMDFMLLQAVNQREMPEYESPPALSKDPELVEGRWGYLGCEAPTSPTASPSSPGLPWGLLGCEAPTRGPTAIPSSAHVEARLRSPLLCRSVGAWELEVRSGSGCAT